MVIVIIVIIMLVVLVVVVVLDLVTPVMVVAMVNVKMVVCGDFVFGDELPPRGCGTSVE